MQTKSWVLPLIVLGLAGIWFMNQRQAISAVKNTNAKLQKNIAVARAANSGAAPVPIPAKSTNRVRAEAPDGIQQANEPLDWKKIAAQCEAMQENYDAEGMARLEKRFEQMSVAELSAALENVATLGLSASSHRLLMDSLLMPLVAKDPEAALTGYMDFLGDNTFGMGGQLADVTKKWAEKDPARAAAWFAEQVAAGRFESKSIDGKNDIREKIEGALFGILLGSDPAAAARSLGILDEEQRVQILEKYSTEAIKVEHHLAFVGVLRSQLSAQAQAKLLGKQGYEMARSSDYAQLTDFLQRISATPAERAAFASEAAMGKITSISFGQKVTRADIDAVRDWTRAQAPGASDAITGKAISDAIWNGGKITFTEASELALQYHKASGNDDTLSAFLSSRSASLNREAARGLAAQISDPARRAEILKKLQ